MFRAGWARRWGGNRENPTAPNTNGSVSFTTGFARNPVANLLPGLPFSDTEAERLIVRHRRFGYFEAFVQDDLKATSNLTLNLGLHSLQLSFNRRLSGKFSVGAACTFSKSLDNASSERSGSEVPPDRRNVDAERGPSDFDRTHVFTANYSWNLPNLARGNHTRRRLIYQTEPGEFVPAYLLVPMPLLGFYISNPRLNLDFHRAVPNSGVIETPFEMRQLLALIAPRPLLLSTSDEDFVFPNDGWSARRALARVEPV